MKAALVAFTILFAPICSSLAQAQSGKAINEHPATQVTFAYLRSAMGQDWAKAADLIEPVSLSDLKKRYIFRIKQSATIDEEIAHVRRLDCVNLKQVEALPAKDFYIRYHKGLQDRFKVDPQKLAKILNTLEVKLLSLAEESVDTTALCHILVRTRHSDGEKQISALDLVSLMKLDGVWKVTLNAQEPYVRAVDGAKK